MKSNVDSLDSLEGVPRTPGIRTPTSEQDHAMEWHRLNNKSRQLAAMVTRITTRPAENKSADAVAAMWQRRAAELRNCAELADTLAMAIVFHAATPVQSHTADTPKGER